MKRAWPALLLPLGLLASTSIAACQGCRTPPDRAADAGARAEMAAPPTLRLYLLSTVAGALEPCGCSKNQLGGFDRFGALLDRERASAPASLLLGAGPLFYLDPVPRGDLATQDAWKADAIAEALKKLGLAAWAPGLNDWAEGDKRLASLRERSGAAMLAANLTGDTGGAVAETMREVGGLKVGIVGASAPVKSGLSPSGVSVQPAGPAVKAAIGRLSAQGARVIVALLAMPRGEALRIAELSPEINVLAIGKPFDQGEGNDKPAPPMLLGNTLVVQAANHLQTAAVVDLHVREGSVTFQDAAGLSRAAERDSLEKRIDEVEKRLRSWEQTPGIDAKDLSARRDEVEKLRAELRRLETPQPPSGGSFFRYAMREVRTDLGAHADINQTMLTFYKKVNEHNQKAFADRKPQPPPADGNHYVGVKICGSCHAPAVEVWKKTSHAVAYKTLEDQFKQFNLDCVSCHVTGYERPGGSTVTSNETLQAVQCEVCHGPGALHAKKPDDKSLLIGKPKPESCVASCHHPPHVDGFEAASQIHRILGPGHGNPDNYPAPKPK